MMMITTKTTGMMITTTIITRSITCVTYQELIDRYLKPLVLDEIEQEKAKEELLELRNRMSIGFLLLNAGFVITLYVLQSNTATLYVTWPCLDNDGNVIKLDPLGFMFLIMFVALMLIQITGMVLHRTSTFLHIMSTTTFSSASPTELDRENTQNMIQLARHLGNLEDEQNAPLRKASTSDGDSMRRRRQWNMARRVNGATVNAEFERRLNELTRNLADNNANVDQLTMRVLAKRGTMGRRARRQAVVAMRTLALGSQTQNGLPTRSLSRESEITGSGLRGVRFVLDETQDLSTAPHKQHPTTLTTHHSTAPY